MKRCVIAGGAPIEDYTAIRSLLSPDDFVIFCDSGLRHLEKLGVSPSLIVGDFDSYDGPRPDAETITLPCVKDDTDSFFAVKEAVKRGFEEFLLIGVTGGRLDHTLGNLSILLYLDSVGKRGVIADDWSEMELIPPEGAFVDDSYSFFSLIAMGGDASGVTIEDAKYPADDITVSSSFQYAVSNEVLPGKRSRITCTGGKLLLIKVR